MPVCKADAVIRNRKTDIILFSKDLQQDLLLVACIFTGVVEKVDKDSDHRALVGVNLREVVRNIQTVN